MYAAEIVVLVGYQQVALVDQQKAGLGLRYQAVGDVTVLPFFAKYELKTKLKLCY